MGKNFNKEQNTVCLLLFVSFVAGLVGVYFNKVGGVRIGRYAIFAAITLVPITFLYLRKVYEVLNAVLLASLGGLTTGTGVAFVGLWYVYDNPSRMLFGPKWLLIGGILIAAFISSIKKLKQDPSEEEQLPNEDFKNLCQLEQLKELEKSLADNSAFQSVTKATFDPLGLAYSAIGLVMMVSVIVSTESSKDRLIMIVVLITIIPICILITIKLRRRSVKNFNTFVGEIDIQRQKALTEIQAGIAKLEASGGNESTLPPENI